MKQFILVLLIFKCVAGQPRVDPLVSTSQGLIRGLQAQDGDYDIFLGIPYAVVDENNPFGPASPHPGFNATFVANQDGVHCTQKNGNIVSGSIQCLQLNVYVPRKANSAHTLPVIVYIHGGSFVRNHKGMSNLSPKFLIRHDVIIVVINYRLGPYGFLCVSEPGYSNQGLKDQLLAIQWVKDNIAAFGGNVNELTFMGQSAGAMNLDVHLFNNERLGKRVILQSGCALNAGWSSRLNDSVPIMLAEDLGFTGEGVKAALDYLSGLDQTEVVKVAEVYNANANNHPITKPCVETVDDDAVLTDWPVNLKPKVKGMDIMIGHANKEMMFLYPNSDKEYYNNYDFSEELLRDFDSAYDEDIVRHFYVGDETGEHLQDAILDYGSDFMFVYPTERTIDRYLEAGANVYRFVFSYEGGRNRNKYRMNLTSPGASHGDDQGYLFDMDIFENQEINEEDQRVIDVMTKMWTDFAKYGNPTPSTSELIPEQWRPVTTSQRTYLNIGSPVTVSTRPFHDRMAFWQLYYKLHGENILGYKP